MAYELGHGEAVTGFDDPGPTGTWFTLHESLPGVSFDSEEMQSFVGDQVDKELIYEIDPDLIAMDPYRAPTLEGLDDSDVEDLSRTVAPFFANRYSVDRGYGGDQPYEYYTLFELYEKYLYPETFGEYPGVGEIPEDEQLFDRQHVSDIINGNL